LQVARSACSVVAFMPGPSSPSLADPLLKVAFVAGLVLLTWLSLNEGTPGPIPGASDKFKHASAYAVLGITGMFAFRRRSRSIASFLFAWGILMEICQGFVPLRSPEFADTLANLLGIILAWGIYHLATARDHPAVSESR